VLYAQRGSDQYLTIYLLKSSDGSLASSHDSQVIIHCFALKPTVRLQKYFDFLVQSMNRSEVLARSVFQRKGINDVSQLGS